MNKRFVTFIILIFTCFNAYPFLIWSPKTGKWKDPLSTPQGSPQAQLKEGLEFFNTGDYKRALKEFSKMKSYYPDAFEAAEAQYYIARCFERLNNHYRAFSEYEKLIRTYPNSKRIQEAVKNQYYIGEYLSETKEKRFLGVPLSVLNEHPAVEVFETIAETSPYSEYAPKALYKLGLFLLERSRYDEAKDAFSKLIDSYPDNELVDSAKYHLALSSSKSSAGSDYDKTAISDARQRLEEVIEKNPQSDVSKEAREKVKAIKDKEAQKDFDTALFYEKQDKINSARIYYQSVIDNYPQTDYAVKAREKIRVLEQAR
ncbi:MAG: outer membrane protein assembly factor BamD [Candidatus Omnitrophota bacterium]